MAPPASSTMTMPLITCSVLKVTLSSAISAATAAPAPTPAATPAQAWPL